MIGHLAKGLLQAGRQRSVQNCTILSATDVGGNLVDPSEKMAGLFC